MDYKYWIGDAVTVEIPHPAGRWAGYGDTIKINAKIVGIDFHNVGPVYRILLSNNDSLTVSQSQIIGKI